MRTPLLAWLLGIVAVAVLVRWGVRAGLTPWIVRPIVAVTKTIARSPTLARRSWRWAKRRMFHLVAVVAALLPTWASLWRCRSARTRRLVRRALRPVRYITTPLRAIARRLWRWATGTERFVGGSSAVRAALVAPTGDRFAPPLRTVYAERLDAMEVRFVIGENRQRDVSSQRTALDDVIEHRRHAIDDAVEAAGQQARALVSASEGLIDAVGGLIVPCCERALARFLEVPDSRGAPLFAAGQLLLHRVFLNPSSPASISDWYAERAARESIMAFQAALDEEVEHGRRVDLFVPPGQRPEGADAASDAIMLATALGPHVAWVAPAVLDELLRHRSHLGVQNPWGQELDLRRPGPGSGRAGVDQLRLTEDRRARLVLEAMRHAPVVSGLIRECPYAMDLTDEPTAEHPGRRLRPLREGVTYVYTRAAEFDPAGRGIARGLRRVLAFDPERFRPGAEATAPPTMSFGAGAHECLGQDIALRLMVAILDPLLSQERVRRDPTRRGLLRARLPPYSPLRSSGAWRFPTRLYVRFEAGVRA